MRKPLTPRQLHLLIGGVTAILVLGYAGFIRAGVFLESAKQEPTRSDLIVSLGGDWGERSEKAAELYRSGYGRHVLLTGSLSLSKRPGKPVPPSRVQVLLNNGVPQVAILLDSQASSTREEAANTLKLMVKMGWQNVLVVSDPPHMRRIAWIWKREFDGSGRQFRVVAASMPEWHPDVWWKNAWSSEFVRNEYLKLGYHLVIDP